MIRTRGILGTILTVLSWGVLGALGLGTLYAMVLMMIRGGQGSGMATLTLTLLVVGLPCIWLGYVAEQKQKDKGDGTSNET